MSEAFLQDKGFTVVKVLGEGAFGKVFLVKDGRGKEFAVKVMSLPDEQGKVDEIYDEIKTLRKLDIYGIPKFYASFVQPGKGGVRRGSKIYVVMEYVKGPDLVDYFGMNPTTNLEKFKILGRVSQILLKMQEQGYVHRDIKPENMIVNLDHRHPEVYVLDLGMICNLNDFKGWCLKGYGWDNRIH